MKARNNNSQIAALVAALAAALFCPVGTNAQEPSAEKTVAYINDKLRRCPVSDGRPRGQFLTIQPDSPEYVRIRGNAYYIYLDTTGHTTSTRRDEEAVIDLRNLSTNITTSRRSETNSGTVRRAMFDYFSVKGVIKIPCKVDNCLPIAIDHFVNLQTHPYFGNMTPRGRDYILLFTCDTSATGGVMRAFKHLITLAGEKEELF